MVDRDYSSSCQKLVELLDEDRRIWLGSVVKLLKERWPIVNDQLSEEVDLGPPPEASEGYFGFESLSGENIEILLIGWQQQVATGFALRNGYIGDDTKEYMGALMQASAEKKGWLGSFRHLFDNEPLTLESVPLPLAYYLMNTVQESEAVKGVAAFLLEKNPLLGVMAQRSTAIAFGDIETANKWSAAAGLPGINQQSSERDTTPEKKGCFIATAAYGESAPEVCRLSRFRDDYLSTFRLGRSFIRVYYRLSPSLATIIVGRPVLRKTARIMVVSPALWISNFLPKIVKPKRIAIGQ